MREAVIVSYARTGLAKSGRGGFNITAPMTMAAHAIKHAVERAGVEKDYVEDSYLGNCAHGARNVGREAALLAGMPITTAGVTGDGTDTVAQTRNILATIDGLLAEAGTSKAKLISANIWLRDIAHFSQMNEVWDQWVDKNNLPVRATVEARLATPELLVEIQVTALV